MRVFSGFLLTVGLPSETEAEGVGAGDRRPTYFLLSGLTLADSSLSGDGQFLFQLLFLEEAGIVAVEGEQFFVATEFYNAALVEHCYLVGVAHG